MSKNKELMNSSVDFRTHHTRGKKCKLVIRVCMTKKILVEEEHESIASAKRAFRENYYPNYHIYNAEYAIIRDGKEGKFRWF